MLVNGSWGINRKAGFGGGGRQIIFEKGDYTSNHCSITSLYSYNAVLVFNSCLTIGTNCTYSLLNLTEFDLLICLLYAVACILLFFSFSQ